MTLSPHTRAQVIEMHGTIDHATRQGGWTPEQVETLRRLWPDESVSAAEIGRRIGKSRSAVLGRVWRDGHTPRRSNEELAWPPERIARLRELWADKSLTTANIAAILGTTRQTIQHRARRLSLPKRERTYPNRSSLPRLPRPRRQTFDEFLAFAEGPVTTQRGPLRREPPPPPPAPLPDLDPILELSQGHDDGVLLSPTVAAVLALSRDTCRWPMGHPGSDEFRFCGTKPRTGKPYCEFHCRIAHQ